MKTEDISLTDGSLKTKNVRSFKSLLHKRLPITSWLPKYSFAKFLQDILAGFSVGLTEVPQGIAYAVVAGLEPQYGLYSAFMGCFVYTVLGSCKEVNIGPTAIMAMMIHPYVEKYGPDGAILLSFLIGCIVFILGLLNLGLIVQFFSYPVVTGFTSAGPIQIASTQINNLLGIKQKASKFLDAWMSVFKNLRNIALWDAFMGITCLVALISMQKLSQFGGLKYNPKWTPRRNRIGRFLWLISLARNAIVILVCSLIAFVLKHHGYTPFRLTGDMVQGLPEMRPPNFNIHYNNVTYSFQEVMTDFGSSIVFLPLLCILETVAIAKAFSKGKPVDATQEMLAVGVSNIFGSFVGSLPVTGSFARTAINNASGVQTPLAGAISGLLIILAMVLLTNSFYYIPKSALAAVIICAMISLFPYDALRILWKSKKSDLLLHVVTLIACLVLGLEYGILLGIATNIVLILYKSTKPPISIVREELTCGDAFIITPSGGIEFSAAEYLRSLVIRNCNKTSQKTIIIDGKYISALDTTIAVNLKILTDELTLCGQNVMFVNFKPSLQAICTGVDSNMFKYFRDDLDIAENNNLV